MTQQTPQLLTLQCPSCGGKSAFHPWDDKLVCQYCGNEHALALPQGMRMAGEGSALPRPQASKPDTVRLERDGDNLRIKVRWFNLRVLPLGFFAVIWDMFICFFYSGLLGGNAPLPMLLFPLGHVAVGVGITYFFIASLLNTTTITINRDYFIVQYDPVPWPGEVKADVEALSQIYCEERIRHNKRSTTITYNVNALLKDGRKKTLLKGLDQPDVAAYIEQTTEKFLSISDRRVTGEAPIG